MKPSQVNNYSDGIAAPDLLRANELLSRGAFSEALILLESLVAEDPTDPSALKSLGIAFTEAGEHTKALKALQRSLSLHEEDAEAHEALGCAFFRLQNLDSARNELERARELDSDSGGILRNLGVVYDRLGRLSDGKLLIERACELNHWDYQALYALASVRLRQSDVRGALDLLDRIALEDSPSELKALAAEHLQNLRRYLDEDPSESSGKGSE